MKIFKLIQNRKKIIILLLCKINLGRNVTLGISITCIQLPYFKFASIERLEKTRHGQRVDFSYPVVTKIPQAPRVESKVNSIS